MISSEILLVIALGITSIFGLLGAVKLSINHSIKDELKYKKACNKILLRQEAYFVNIPIAYIAMIFYSILILQLIQLFNEKEIHFYWINI